MNERIENAMTDAITTPAAGREAVVSELRSRWVGPYGGETETLERSPAYAYLVGTLYPVEERATVAAASVVEDYTEDLESEFDVEEQEAWVESADAAEDADDSDGVNLQGAFGWAPNSMGVSFLHSGTTLEIRVSAGLYSKGKKQPVDETLTTTAEGSSEGGDMPSAPTGPREIWVREPIETVEFITVSDSGRMAILDGRAELSWRSRTYKGKLLTTVAVRNADEVAQGEAKRHPEKCLFQVEMSCTDESGVLPYPQSNVHASLEDHEIAFRYRDKPSFGIGHGTAVDWMPIDSPVTIVTQTVPEVESRPIRARDGAGDAVKMRWLADETVAPEDLARGLKELAAQYATWIDAQQVTADGAGAQDSDVANRIVERQRAVLERMHEGIELLTTDEVIRTSFRMANIAMRWQMLRGRGSIPAYARYGSDLSGDRGAAEPTWRPFQLAFILASLASTVNDEHADRELVDLIWFPTGGGKTEAYLGLAAIEMIRRRLVHGVKGGGMAVLTRYTMRLLTAQQFQRAATLICALELMREDDARLDGAPGFSIGLWLGNSTTPGTYKEADTQFQRARKESRPENPFQLLACPWCGKAIMPERHTRDDGAYGVRASAYGFAFFCPDAECSFSQELPVQVVDEGVYDNPPTMLVATVDKLARLAWIDKGSRLFGATGVCIPPSLVIQDELHLLSGPLGTIVGVYEAAIAALLSWRGTSPKVVASTATTRAASEQIRELMAKKVVVFPPPGLNADDNYFSEPDPDPSVLGRKYLGIMPQAHTPSWAIGQLSTEMLNAPVAAGLSGEVLDAYWTLVVYHNSLRELGRTVTILRDDVTSNLGRRGEVSDLVRSMDSEGVEELNGNVSSTGLTELLQRLEKSVGQAGVIDALATTNIMSVGIDVSRLGLMLVNGHTKTTSEYIQATSRVGRGKIPGLVVTMFRSSKPRDRSVYETFGAYHRNFYRFVEPSSVSPWSVQARRRALRAALVILVRHAVGLSANGEAAMFDPDSIHVKKAVSLLKEHVCRADRDQARAVADEIDTAVLDWSLKRATVERDGGKLVYQSKNGSDRLMRQFTEPGEGWPVMNSMRNVDRVIKVRANGERRGN